MGSYRVLTSHFVDPSLSIFIDLSFKYMATNIQMTVLPKVRTALCAARQLPGEGPTDVEDTPAPAR